MEFLDDSQSCQNLVTVQEIVSTSIGHVKVAKGDFERLPQKVQDFIARWVEVCKPRGVYICDGSLGEAKEIIHKLEERGTLHRLTRYDNCYIVRTDPSDVARVESKTWICTPNKYDTVPHTRSGVKGILGQWKSEEEADEFLCRYKGCMAGRMMYVIPYSMGPIGSPLSKYGVEITDSNYVLLCMRIMTRVSPSVFDQIHETGEFVRCVHSMGCPRPVQRKVINHWPCNPESVFIGHFPQRRMICSYGSGYGGNSLLGKKCFALRIASNIARDEGWLAEHMLIMGITSKKTGKEVFLAAAFPSACGKTNLSMLESPLPDYTVKVVGDDIAWMRFDKDGQLRGINPEAGFFGVCPGTNMHTNPNAMKTLLSNSIFTNIAETADGGIFWEGLENEDGFDGPRKHIGITDWKGQPFNIGKPGVKAAHPNSRFTCPASQCPIIHPKWEDPEGVPISAFIFGGRRPDGIPLVYETFSWKHGVAVGAGVKSEATAAAEHAGKQIMHDPFAMRPFMGYNFGKYMEHWLSLDNGKNKLPKIFHVNWFRVDENGKFLWPGFGENIRVLEWIMRRCEGEEGIATRTALGYVPKQSALNLEGLKQPVNFDALFHLPRDYLREDCLETVRYLRAQVGPDVPWCIREEYDEMLERIDELIDDDDRDHSRKPQQQQQQKK